MNARSNIQISRHFSNFCTDRQPFALQYTWKTYGVVKLVKFLLFRTILHTYFREYFYSITQGF